MHKHPTPTIKGSRPQNLPHRQSDDVAKLSKRYLQVGNRAIDLKNKSAEVELALKRSVLVDRRLVEIQATWLLLAMRQKLMNLTSHCPQVYRLDRPEPNQSDPARDWSECLAGGQGFAKDSHSALARGAGERGQIARPQ
jgi:hypothetical protein